MGAAGMSPSTTTQFQCGRRVQFGSCEAEHTEKSGKKVESYGRGGPWDVTLVGRVPGAADAELGVCRLIIRGGSGRLALVTAAPRHHAKIEVQIGVVATCGAWPRGAAPGGSPSPSARPRGAGPRGEPQPFCTAQGRRPQEEPQPSCTAQGRRPPGGAPALLHGSGAPPPGAPALLHGLGAPPPAAPNLRAWPKGAAPGSPPVPGYTQGPQGQAQ